MTYLQLVAAGHVLLIEAVRVDRIDEVARDALDLSLRLGGAAPGRVVVTCMDGPALAVDAVRGIIDAPEDALLPVPWLPATAAALVDAMVAGGWRLRTNLPA